MSRIKSQNILSNKLNKSRIQNQFQVICFINHKTEKCWTSRGKSPGKNLFQPYGCFAEENIEGIFARKEGDPGALPESHEAAGFQYGRVIGGHGKSGIKMFYGLRPKTVKKINKSEMNQKARIVGVLLCRLTAPLEPTVVAVEARIGTGKDQSVEGGNPRIAIGPHRLLFQEELGLLELPVAVEEFRLGVEIRRHNTSQSQRKKLL